MRFEVYVDGKSEFRWRLWSKNDKIVADSGEGYQSKQHCVDAIALIRREVTTAPVVQRTAAGQVEVISV